MVDVVARLSGPVAMGSDAPASISMGGGGSAANVAAWLAFAGAPSVLVARVGGDSFGARAAAELRAAGVDARLALDGERPTGVCVVLVAPGGERSMVPDPGANAALSPSDLPDGVFAAGDHLHVSGYSLLREGPRAAALAAIERGRSTRMSVSADPASAALLSPAFLDLAEGAGLLLPNLAEATALTGIADPRDAARALAGRFPEVVVKLGAEGALWTNGSDEERVPAAALPAGALADRAAPPAATAAPPAATAAPPAGTAAPLDTTGAGDAFAAGLLAARLRDAAPREALAAGCELAARAVVTPGARPPSGAA
jgi:sugar/nucleoside kinase (ribokinase family)